MSIEKALEQMTRGMSSEQGRQEVNAETHAERVHFRDSWIERQKALKLTNTKKQKSFDQRMADGEFGRLD